jgi:hypothetical protein
VITIDIFKYRAEYKFPPFETDHMKGYARGYKVGYATAALAVENTESPIAAVHLILKLSQIDGVTDTDYGRGLTIGFKTALNQAAEMLAAESSVTA